MSTASIMEVELRIGGMTCHSCVRRVERALGAVQGVQKLKASVGRAAVAYDSEQTNLMTLTEAIRAAGYEPLQVRERPVSAATGWRRLLALLRPLMGGALGTTGLLVLYVAIVGAASRSPEHVLDLLATDWPLLAAIALGFGVQVGLYSHLRSLTRVPTAANAATGVGTGTSTVAMVACCAHHATDILPVLGLTAVAGAVGFLTEWRVPLMGLGILMNLVGIALTLRLIRRVQSPSGPATVVACRDERSPDPSPP